jgi:hypothetical protein
MPDHDPFQLNRIMVQVTRNLVCNSSSQRSAARDPVSGAIAPVGDGSGF